MRGERVPIKSEKARLGILAAQQLLLEIQATTTRVGTTTAAAVGTVGTTAAAAAAAFECLQAQSGTHGATTTTSDGDDSGGGLMAVYDKLFVAFNDALDAIRSDLRVANREQSAKSEVSKSTVSQSVSHNMYRRRSVSQSLPTPTTGHRLTSSRPSPDERAVMSSRDDGDAGCACISDHRTVDETAIYI